MDNISLTIHHNDNEKKKKDVIPDNLQIKNNAIQCICYLILGSDAILQNIKFWSLMLLCFRVGLLLGLGRWSCHVLHETKEEWITCS